MGWIKGLALFLILAATGTVALLATRSVQSPAADRVLPTGKEISPLGEHVEVGSYPVNMVLSKDGRFVVVTSSGYRQQLTVIDAATGAITDKVDFGGVGSKTGLYYGLSVGASGKVYASQGALDKIATFDLSETGKLVASRVFDNPPPAGLKGPNHVSGVSESGGNLVVVNNQTTKETKLKGSISVLDIATGERKSSFEVGGFPYGVATVNGQAYVSSERDGIVSTIDLASGKSDSIRVGQNSTTVMVTPDQRTVLVSNSNSDTVSVIGVASKRVTKTILLRPADLRSVPGCTPLGIAVEKDNKRAFVAMADLNAVAVVDLEKGQLEGYLPVGWYPTSVIVAGNNLFVSNAKGVKTKNPNGKAVGTRGKYILNIIEGDGLPNQVGRSPSRAATTHQNRPGAESHNQT